MSDVKIPGGRYRVVMHVVDDEPWRDELCPECGNGFTEDPRFICAGDRMHFMCAMPEDGQHRPHGYHFAEPL